MSQTLADGALLTCGLDVGARSVKVAILSDPGTASPTVLAQTLMRIQGRSDAVAYRAAVRESWNRALAEASLSAGEIDYVASTGARSRQVIRVGRFYERSSHAVGARLLFPDATAALDIGSDQIRCGLLGEGRDERRYATIELEAPDVGPGADLATRAVGLVQSIAAGGKIALTGGMVLDADFVRGLWNHLLGLESRISLLISPDAIFAGATGAAILAARRFRRISRISRISRTVVRAPDRLALLPSSLDLRLLN
jgi:activator of 2-hydroxyglutaryl-CoA dehydratase